MLSDCQCFHPLYLDIDTIRGGRPPCDLSHSETEECVESIFTQFNLDQRKCTCNASCTELSYVSLPSSSVWPSKKYEDTAETNYGFGANAPAPAAGGQQPSMSENLLHVSVYFDSFNTKYVINKKVYEVSEVVLCKHIQLIC